MEKKNYIPIQCGFRKGHRSVQAVIEITNTLGKAIDNNLYTCGAFLDFSKAFDTVNYEIWLNRLDTVEYKGLLYFKVLAARPFQHCTNQIL